MAPVDFSPLGDLYNTYRQGRDRAMQEQALQQFAQNGSQFDPATRQLIAANPQLGMSLAQLSLANKRDERDFGFRREESQRTQGNLDRSHALAVKQAEEAARGFDYREIDDGMGGKKLVRIEKATGAISAPSIDGAQDAPNNPFMTGKLNESQSKDALFASRMLGAEKILRATDAAVATDRIQKGLGTISDKIGYDLRSPEFTKFDQAKRDFINAVLRKESGAVISESEFKNAEQQYFPQPGQGADIIAQKRQARMEAIRGVGAGAGPGYRPDYRFDDKGEIIDNPKPQPRAQVAKPDPNAWKSKETITAARSNPQGALAEAQQAIQRGADPRAVAQRLQQVGIDPSPLFQNSGFAGPGQRE